MKSGWRSSNSKGHTSVLAKLQAWARSKFDGPAWVGLRWWGQPPQPGRGTAGLFGGSGGFIKAPPAGTRAKSRETAAARLLTSRRVLSCQT